MGERLSVGVGVGERLSVWMCVWVSGREWGGQVWVRC